LSEVITMNWLEVCEHPDLQNLPFKIELDESAEHDGGSIFTE